MANINCDALWQVVGSESAVHHMGIADFYAFSSGFKHHDIVNHILRRLRWPRSVLGLADDFELLFESSNHVAVRIGVKVAAKKHRFSVLRGFVHNQLHRSQLVGRRERKVGASHNIVAKFGNHTRTLFLATGQGNAFHAKGFFFREDSDAVCLWL